MRALEQKVEIIDRQKFWDSYCDSETYIHPSPFAAQTEGLSFDLSSGWRILKIFESKYAWVIVLEKGN